METQPQIKPQTELTFEHLPSAVAHLITQVAKLETLIRLQIAVEPEKRKMIGVPEAAKIINVAIRTVYWLVKKKGLPHFKKGNQLYFYEDEILTYIRNRDL
jgi:excisionase family DNA binding protein